MIAAHEQESVRAAFTAWASAQKGAPRDVGSLVQDVNVTYEHAGFLMTDIQGRRVVWKAVPTSSNARVTRPPITLETVDPWNVEATELRTRSEHIAECGTCSGERCVACSVCRGIGKRICGTCGGQRKMYGYAANGARRLLNCKNCRGKGEVDCECCLRGIATCETCKGEGRLQRWIELEWWRRSTNAVHPPSLAEQCHWNGNTPNDTIARDAEVVADIERPNRLTTSDLGAIPSRWLEALPTKLEHGERVVRQRLRIARIPTYAVRYRLGADEDRVTFSGRTLAAPPSAIVTAFTRRASGLRSLSWFLLIVACILIAVSLGRGTFYWSLPTLASLIGFGAALGSIYGAAADRSSLRRHTQSWLFAAGTFVIIAMACAYAALPRLEHAQSLIAAGDLEEAERELRALSDHPKTAWADLYLERVERATDIDAARAALKEIPRGVPQYSLATNALDGLVLRTVADYVREQRFPTAADTLALLSDRARATRDGIATATSVYLPLARGYLDDANWRPAATTIADARRFGVSAAQLDPLAEEIRAATNVLLNSAKRESNAEQRLRNRIDAERLLMEWERATGRWGSPAIIALRESMSRDLVAAERNAKRGRR